ncbi:MAG: hypothetical protein MJ190_00615 [Bacilli bacterium]|nr:hypothetical protein [Bacilli bacterium]
MENQQYPQQNLTISPEEKKQKSKNRIFVLITALDVLLALLIVFEVVDLFF